MNPKYTNHPAVSLLSELLDIPSPPGREEHMSRLLVEKIKAMGFNPETDPAGNLMVRFTEGKSGDPLVFAAHMDEIALVVQHIEPDGRLRVIRSGGLFPYKTGERVFDILGDEKIIKGVLSCGSGHGQGEVTRQSQDWSGYWVFTGLTEAQLRAAGVCEGAPMVPERAGRGPLLFGDPESPFIAAWTFDDRMGVVALLRLLESISKGHPTPDWPMIIAFTVHEEGGCHGAKVLAHRENPAVFIAIDGAPMGSEARLSLDGGPCVWTKDRKINYSYKTTQWIINAAADIGITIQRAAFESAASDASAVYEAGAAPQVAIFGPPRENSHGYEIARLSMFDKVLRVLEQLLKTPLAD